MSVISGGRVNPRDVQLGNVGRTILGWTSTGDTADTFANIDRSGGGFRVEHNNDNECAVVVYGGEMFDFGDVGCRGSIRWKQKYTSPSTGGNMFIGFTDTADNTFIADGDTLVSGDHIGIAMLSASDASRAWLPVAQNAAANSGTAGSALGALVAAGLETSFRIEWEGLTAGLTIRYYVDEVLLQTVTGLSYTSFGPELQLAVAISPAGASVNTLDVYEMFVSHRAMS